MDTLKNSDNKVKPQKAQHWHMIFQGPMKHIGDYSRRMLTPTFAMDEETIACPQMCQCVNEGACVLFCGYPSCTTAYFQAE